MVRIILVLLVLSGCSSHRADSLEHAVSTCHLGGYTHMVVEIVTVEGLWDSPHTHYLTRCYNA